MDENKQAILLLSAHFSAPAKGASTPLTALEYGRFAVWMRDNGFQPKDLFHRVDDLLGQWLDPKGKVTGERVRYLLGRGLAMGLAIEKWHSAGIWIVARSDGEYPQRLKQRLGHAAPAVLFGVGSKALLNAGGLAVVGSRNIGDAESSFTRVVASQAAAEGLNVVSGGARGVDETSMLAALEVEGTALGIVANDLFKSALSGKWRKYLKSEQLVLVSPFYPEARFQVGNAMGRNKYIYCLAEAALVVRSEQGSGGTWAGATENLKNAWVPLFVATPSDAQGNVALQDMGAKPLQAGVTGQATENNWLSAQLGALQINSPAEVAAVNKPAEGGVKVGGAAGVAEPSINFPLVTEKTSGAQLPVEKSTQVAEQSELSSEHSKEQPAAEQPAEQQPAEHQSTTVSSSYAAFSKDVSALLAEKNEVDLAEINARYSSNTKVQVREWVDRAVAEGVLNRPTQRLKFVLGQQSDNPVQVVQ